MYKYILYYLKNFFILIRINKPTGMWLLMFPTFWALIMASEGKVDIQLLVLFAFGSFIMRSAGCIINDIIDKKIDSNIVRTKNRPLASGSLNNADALILLIIFLSIGLSILLSLNTNCIILGIAVFPLIIIYPFMKRLIYFPQLILAITFNFGTLIAWTAVAGYIDKKSLILYFSCVFWTLAYDTIYALQDKIDDEKFGIKSLAIYLGKNNKYWIIFFYLCFISGIIYLGITINLNFIFFFLIILFTLKIIFEVIKLDLYQPKNCTRNFQLNSWYGFFITISLCLNYI